MLGFKFKAGYTAQGVKGKQMLCYLSHFSIALRTL